MNIGVQRMILSQKYDLGDCLGEGTFASVSEAVNKNTNKSVAIKQIFIQAHFIDQAVDQVKKATMVKSDHVVKVLDYFYDDSDFYFNVVLELCPSSLRDQISDKKKYSEAQIVQFLIQMCSAFLSLRDNNLIHLDFKPQNVLTIDATNKFFKICDFGCAQISMYSRMSGYEKNAFGTFNYLAPEIHLNYKGEKRRSSADIWALGITLYEMIYQHLPFLKKPGDSNIDRPLLENYFHEQGYQLQFSYNPQISQKMVALIKMMLAPKPINRPANWPTIKEYLIKEFQVQEFQFLSIQKISQLFIPVGELFSKVLNLLKGNVAKSAFWKSNQPFLTQIKHQLMYYIYIVIEPIQSTFNFKSEHIDFNQKQTVKQLLNFLISERSACPDKINLFEKKDRGYREMQLLDGLKRCIELIQGQPSKDQHMKFLLTFCQEFSVFVKSELTQDIIVNGQTIFGKSFEF